MTKIFEEMITFIGSDQGEPKSLNTEHHIHSGSLVITVAWSWSPAHSRVSEYRIFRCPDYHVYDLYEIFFDDLTETHVFANVATGKPCAGTSEKDAAWLLLKSTWESEMQLFEFDPSSPEIINEGILNGDDIYKIVTRLYFTNNSTWLSNQSEESLDVLASIIATPLSDADLDLLDQIDVYVDELQVSRDFIDLCEKYNLVKPDLSLLVDKLSDEAESLDRERAESAHLFAKEIDLLVSELNPSSSRAGGITAPSLQQRVRAFLENYVKRHNSLPLGSHKVHEIFGPVVDFDHLRKKYKIQHINNRN